MPALTATVLHAGRMSSRKISDTVGGARHRGSSLYTVDTELPGGLRPDVVLAQNLCEVCAVSYRPVSQAVRMLDAGPTVISVEPRTLGEVLDGLLRLGELLDAAGVAAEQHARLLARLGAVRRRVEPAAVRERKTVSVARR